MILIVYYTILCVIILYYSWELRELLMAWVGQVEVCSNIFLLSPTLYLQNPSRCRRLRTLTVQLGIAGGQEVGVPR